MTQNKTNTIVWFNVGINNREYSSWQTCIVDGDFSPESFRFESCKWDENGENPQIIWVTRENLNHTLPQEVAHCFDNIEELLSKVKDATELPEDISYQGAEIHIYNIFDMDDRNEWGHGRPLWD